MVLLIYSSPGLCEEVRCYYFHLHVKRLLEIVHSQQSQIAEVEQQGQNLNSYLFCSVSHVCTMNMHHSV